LILEGSTNGNDHCVGEEDEDLNYKSKNVAMPALSVQGRVLRKLIILISIHNFILVG
jgi:hypothetical protein